MKKLVFIYGPPAAGKLTVAQELARISGYRLFHNHLTIDLAEALYPRGTPGYFELVDGLRWQMFERAARDSIPLIFTYVYAHGPDDAYIRNLQLRLEAFGVQLHFVQLTCRREKLVERVLADSRKRFGKIRDVTKLGQLLEQYDLQSPIPFVQSLCIDASEAPPYQTAARIWAEVNYAN